MMPCRPAMMFCSIVGQASRQTAGPIGPSTMDRSNFLNLPPGSATEWAVYYAEPAVRLRLRRPRGMSFQNRSGRSVVAAEQPPLSLGVITSRSLIRSTSMLGNQASLRVVLLALVTALVIAAGATA